MVARWEPDARGRLLRAALELFLEQGYDETTTQQIAERAGLTKTTLFRLFADKREILFQGQPALVSLVVSAVESAPPAATPGEVLRAAVLALCPAHTREQQVIGRQIDRLTAAHPELRERAAFKRAAITAALESALATRIGEGHLAGVLADLGIRAYYNGFASWTDLRQDDELVEVVEDELAALDAVIPTVSLGTTH